jgi:hypothetical protein
MNNVSLTFQMLGAGPGTIPMSTPSKTDYAFNFISLVNLTDNFVSLIGNQSPLPIIQLGAYSAITLPMQSSLYENISLAWTNPTGSDLATTKQGLVIYSSDNIGINQAFSPGFNSGGIGANVNATIIQDNVGLAQHADLVGVAKDGTDGAGITPPTGGAGIRGWLSGIYNTLLTAGIAVATLPALVASSAIIGKVGIDQTTPGSTNAVQVVEVTAGKGLKPATACTIYAVTMTSANTEYSQVLPASVCRKLAMMVQTNDAEFRVSFVTGKVAAPVNPFIDIPVGAGYGNDFIELPASTTIYFASPTAGKIMQIECWN